MFSYRSFFLCCDLSNFACFGIIDYEITCRMGETEWSPADLAG